MSVEVPKLDNKEMREIVLEPEIGATYIHTSGLKYEVNEIILSAENYEKTGLLSKKVLYTQLDKGEVCSAGTKFVRSLEDFNHNFVKEEEKI